MKELISFCVLIGVAFTGFASVGAISAAGCEGAQPPESSYELEPGVWLTYYYDCIDGEWVQQERIEDKRATATTTAPTATSVQATETATQAPPATVQVTATVQATATEPVATTQATETATPVATGIARPSQPTPPAIEVTDTYTDIVVVPTLDYSRPVTRSAIPEITPTGILAPPATAETRNNFEATPTTAQAQPPTVNAASTPDVHATLPADLATPATCPFMDDEGCGRG